MKKHGTGTMIISVKNDALSWIPGGRQRQVVYLSHHLLGLLRRSRVLRLFRFLAFNRFSWMKMGKNFSEMMSQEISVFAFPGQGYRGLSTETTMHINKIILRPTRDSISQEMDVCEMLMDIIGLRDGLTM